MAEEVKVEEMISRRLAAVEVLRVRTGLKTVFVIAIGALWASLFAGSIFPMGSAVVVVLGTGVVGFFMIRNKKEIEYLQGEYQV